MCKQQASKQASSFWCVFFSTLCFLHKFSLLSPCKICTQTFVVAVVDCGLQLIFFLLLLWVVGCISFSSLFCLKEIFVWCWCCSGLQLLVEGLCCLFVILFAFGELGVVLLLLCLSVVSSLNLLSLSLWSFL